MAGAFSVSRYPIVYRGSVKNLRVIEPATERRPGRYLFEFTDDYSVFDYGKMPDRLPGKGAAMAVGTAYLFERLEDAATWKQLATSLVWERIHDAAFRDRLLASPAWKALRKSGLATHYRGLVTRDGRRVRTDALREPTNLMEVAAVPIVRPEGVSLGGKLLYNYNRVHPGLAHFLVPLECIFRFGIPQGSSLLERLSTTPGYHSELGLARRPHAGSWLPFPVVELFSKLEPADRFLRPETALNFSGLSGGEFRAVYDLTRLVAIFLLDLYSARGITLWDGKFEFVKMGRLALGDAITPDELRLTFRKVQISKEPLRQYYKRYDEPFVAGMKEAKALSAQTGEDLRKILKEKLRVAPQRLPDDLLRAAAGMYTSITARTTGLPVFGAVPEMDDVLATFRRYGVA